MNKQSVLILDIKNKRSTLRAYSMSVLFCSLHTLHGNTIDQSKIDLHELHQAQRVIYSPVVGIPYKNGPRPSKRNKSSKKSYSTIGTKINSHF
jgi:hypothetical protein